MRKLKSLFTAEDIIHLPTTGCRLELIKGKVYEMPPAGGRHGSIAMRIGVAIEADIRPNRLGETFAGETGFILSRNPDTVLATDASFVAAGRLPGGDLPVGYLELAPDLVVEVISPNDRPREVEEKAASWLTAGVRLVWVIDSGNRTARVYRAEQDVEDLSSDGSLDGGDVIPGFSCQIQDLFA